MSTSETFWDRSASTYDKTEGRFERIHGRARERAKRHLKKSDIVLDYGCGTGTTACAISGSVRSVRAIDISTAMIDIARGKAAAGGVANVDFGRADIFDEGFEPGSFDAVLAFNMLHTVPDPRRVVRRTIELLKPGGSFISVTPCLRGDMSASVSLQILLVRLLLRLRIIPIPIRRLESADLDDLMDDERLRVIETEEIFQGASSYFMVAKKAS